MARAVTMAAAARHQITSPSADATAVPTRTGTMAAGSVRGLAPATHLLISPGKLPAVPKLRAIDATGGAAFVTALRAAWDDGDAVLPVDPRFPPPARARLLERLDVERPVEPGDAVVVATSGTRGEPKGVVLTHDAVRASALAIHQRLGADPATDTWLACLPLSHVGALAVVMRSLVTETTVIVHDGFDPAAVMASGATLTALVPTALQRIDPACFRLIL